MTDGPDIASVPARASGSGTVADALVRNTRYHVVGQVALGLLGALLTPYLASRLGAERFAVWALAASLVAYLSLLDLGMGTAVVRFVADGDGRGDPEQVNRALGAGLLALLVSSVVSLLLAGALLSELLRWFRVPADLAGEARTMLRLALLAWLVTAPLGSLQALLDGLQRMDVSNLVGVGTAALGAVGAVAALELGLGLPGLGVVGVLVAGVRAVALVALARRIFPPLRLRPRRPDRRTIERMFRYGLQVHAIRIATLLTTDLEKVLVGALGGLQLVTHYELGSRLGLLAQRFPALLSAGVLPAAAHLGARGEQPRLAELYRRGTKYSSLLVFPIIAFIEATAPELLALWVGPGHEPSVPILRTLAVGYIGGVLAVPGAAILQGTGELRRLLPVNLAMTLLNLLLSTVLVLGLGFRAAALGTTLALGYGVAHALLVYGDRFGLKARDVLRSIFLPPLLAGGIAAAATRALLTRLDAGPTSGRPALLLELGAGAVVFAAVYAAAILWGRFLDASDRRFIRERLLPFTRRQF